jgi:hypothetical protein
MMVLACSFVLMNPTEIAKYNETQEQWLLELLSRRQDLSIQTAKVDVEISVVRGVLRAHEMVKANGVIKGGESSVEDAARSDGLIVPHGGCPTECPVGESPSSAAQGGVKVQQMTKGREPARGIL